MEIVTKVRKRKGRTILVVLVLYCLIYFGLSRLYLCVNEEYIADDPEICFVPYKYMGTMPGQIIHHSLRYFFYPVWCVDHIVFGAPPLSNLHIMRISG